MKKFMKLFFIALYYWTESHRLTKTLVFNHGSDELLLQLIELCFIDGLLIASELTAVLTLCLLKRQCYCYTAL